ncbi:hypothetical protein ACLB2K_016449 [Fragaria x ananassa]
MLNSFRSAIRSMWRLSVLVEIQAKDHYLFSFANERDLNRVLRGGLWAYQRIMILLNHFNGFLDIVAVSLDLIWIWVEVSSMPPGLLIELAIHLVKETIGPMLGVDGQGLRSGNPRMFGRCHVCSMINHGGQCCPIMVEAEPTLMPPPPSRPKMVFKAASSTLVVLSVPALNLKVHDKKVVTIRELLKGGVASARVSGHRHQ